MRSISSTEISSSWDFPQGPADVRGPGYPGRQPSPPLGISHDKQMFGVRVIHTDRVDDHRQMFDPTAMGWVAAKGN